ncbi:MAG: conserved membrane protein of unknown function [Candidatus Thorarchaeota archaeon]|nr:MAG: conserved membrane protein of unknown function [Candidatus Thorarchaeota archaeon]
MQQLLTHPVVSGLILMAIIGALTYRLRFVDVSGLISAFIVGFTVWYTGGPAAFTLLLFFFVSSGIATKFKYKAKAKQGFAQEQKGKRSWKNVFGSGLIPMIFSVAMYLSPLFSSDPNMAFYMFGGFIGAVATTSADTLASEVGIFSKGKPRLITNLRRKVPRGTIGAVSLLGEGIAAAAGLLIGLIVVIYGVLAPELVPTTDPSQLLLIIPLSVLTAFIGCNIDSLLGAAFQNKFVCEICGAVTDKHFHCSYETKYIGGFKRFTNMHVNFGSSGAGAAFGIVLGAGLFVWILGGLFFWILASSSN